jgi:putative exporter of polyketide antibiotics
MMGILTADMRRGSAARPPRLPGWGAGLSPFDHAPPAPTEPVTAVPLLGLLAAAAALGTVGVLAFRRDYAF